MDMDMDVDMNMDNGFVKLEDTFNFDSEHKYLIKVEPYDTAIYQQQSESIMDYYFSNPEKDNEYDEDGNFLYSNKEVDLNELIIIRNGTKFEARIFQIYYSDKHLDTNGNKLQYVKFTDIEPLQDNIRDYIGTDFEAPLSQVWIKDLTAEEEELANAVNQGVEIDNNGYTATESVMDVLSDMLNNEEDNNTIIIDGKTYDKIDDYNIIQSIQKEKKTDALKARSNIVRKLPTLKKSILPINNTKQIVLKPSELQKRLTQKQPVSFVFNFGKGGKKISRKIYNKGKKVSRKKVTKRVKRKKVSKRKTNKK